ncbi:MAG: SpaA isopeptide-forming pilin-related protein [Bacilli bacterium]
MKKLLLMIFGILITIIPDNAVAGSLDTYITWNLDYGVVVNRPGTKQINLAIKDAGGRIAYCIEPGVDATKSWYDSYNNRNDFNLSDDELRYLELVAYYGYGNFNHSQKEYYMAAQELIWLKMGVPYVVWTSDRAAVNVINIDKYKEEILNNVSNHAKYASFDLSKTYLIGDKIILKDYNDVLSNFTVFNSIATNNKLFVDVVENTKFTLKRKQIKSSTIVYKKAGFQTIASFGMTDDYVKEYQLKSTYGSISVNRIKTSKLNFGSKLSKYAIYNDKDNLISEKEVDENEMVTFNNLTAGSYYVLETQSETGYINNNYKHKVKLNSNNIDVKLEVYPQVIKNNLTIKKVIDDKNSGIIKNISGVTFGIYNEYGDLIIKEITNSDGIIETELPYGKYFLKQISEYDENKKPDDMEVIVTEPGVSQTKIFSSSISKEVEKENITINDNVYVDNNKPNKIKTLPSTGKKSLVFLLSEVISIIGGIGLACEKKNI